MKLSVLIDNITKDEGLLGEWGLSVYIEYKDKKILLDTGASDAFLKNAETMGIDLKKVDFGVLSHAHYDHADGLDAFFDTCPDIPFYLSENCRENAYGIKEDEPLKYIGIKRGLLKQYDDRIRFVKGTVEIADGVWLIPHSRKDYSKTALRGRLYRMEEGEKEASPENFNHEQSLVLETKEGLVIFNSCSHTGMENIVEEVREQLPGKKILAYFGGLHLFLLNDDEIMQVADLIGTLGIEKVMTGHCTGDHAFELLQERLPGVMQQFHSGFSWECE